MRPLGFVAITLVSFALIGCGSKTALAPAKTTFKSVEYTGTGYTILFPEDWKQQTGVVGTEIAAVGAPSSATPDFAPNVNVVVMDMPRNVYLDGFWPTTLRTMQAVNGFKQIEEGDVALPCGKSKRLLWEHTMTNRTLRVATYVVTNAGKAYAITCSDTPESFGTSEPTFVEIVNSMRFK